MASLYTKNGIPLTVQGDAVFNPAGKNFGQLQNGRVYGLDGRYRGTVDGDRLVYRSTDAAGIVGARASVAGSPNAEAKVAGVAIQGNEPNINP